MLTAITYFGHLMSLTNVVFWIYILVKMFKYDGTSTGIFGILCAIYAFFWGWTNIDGPTMKGVMIGWTAVFLLDLAAQLSPILLSG
jgi:hypothetical protein